MLNKQQKLDVERLRNYGWGYRKIAYVINASRDEVRNYCKTKKLDGRATEFVVQSYLCVGYSCRMCGNKMIPNKTGRPRVYCSSGCKRKWDDQHQVLHEMQCQHCGKVVYVQNSAYRKYCSHECYIRDRFWREDDATKIIKLLMAGEHVHRVPQWLKDLLVNEDKSHNNPDCNN